MVGETGSGKTTIMKMLSGFLEPDQGRITVDGVDLGADARQVQRQLGYLPENVSFNMALTGRETLAFYARLKRVPVATTGGLLERRRGHIIDVGSCSVWIPGPPLTAYAAAHGDRPITQVRISLLLTGAAEPTVGAGIWLARRPSPGGLGHL